MEAPAEFTNRVHFGAVKNAETGTCLDTLGATAGPAEAGVYPCVSSGLAMLIFFFSPMFFFLEFPSAILVPN